MPAKFGVRRWYPPPVTWQPFRWADDEGCVAGSNNPNNLQQSPATSNITSDFPFSGGAFPLHFLPPFPIPSASSSLSSRCPSAPLPHLSSQKVNPDTALTLYQTPPKPDPLSGYAMPLAKPDPLASPEYAMSLTKPDPLANTPSPGDLWPLAAGISHSPSPRIWPVAAPSDAGADAAMWLAPPLSSSWSRKGSAGPRRSTAGPGDVVAHAAPLVSSQRLMDVAREQFAKRRVILGLQFLMEAGWNGYVADGAVPIVGVEAAKIWMTTGLHVTKDWATASLRAEEVATAGWSSALQLVHARRYAQALEAFRNALSALDLQVLVRGPVRCGGRRSPCLGHRAFRKEAYQRSANGGVSRSSVRCREAPVRFSIEDLCS